ncbi:MAG: Lrp/AsnC family transcriptional regulator [Butyricicoccaceae bacterium]
MDKIDIQLLRCLQKNSRAKASDISRQINLSVSAVIERIRKLEESGVIRQYTLLLDNRKMGNDITALIEVNLEHPRYYDSFTKMVMEHPYIVSCYYLTGDFDFELKVITDSSDHLESIHRDIKSMTGVHSTRTHFVLKNVKFQSCVIPDD